MFAYRDALLRMLEAEENQSIWTLIFIDCVKKSKSEQEIKECMKKLDDKIQNNNIPDACKVLEYIMVHDIKNIAFYVSRMQKLLRKNKANITLVAESLYRYFNLVGQISDKKKLNKTIKELGLSLELSKEIKKRGKFASRKKASSANSRSSYLEIPEEFLRDPFRNTNLLRYFSNNTELLKKMPFKGKHVFFTLHFLRDLIPFIKAAMNLGLDMEKAHFFYKDYPYPQKEAIKKWLEKQGATVGPRSHIPKILKQFADRYRGIDKILVVEDGGFFVPIIHGEFPQLIPNVIGVVEQTTRGIRNAENWQKEKGKNKLRFPIISVATSKLKSEFEPPYIAAAVVDNIKRLLPNIALRGKSAALFGCGTIGQNIAEWLRPNGVNVTIFELDCNKRLWADQKAFSLTNSVKEAVRNKSFVIGASGNESINSEAIASLSHGTYLLSASSELYEIDMDELSKQARKKNILQKDNKEKIGTTFILPPNDRCVHVLANGYPINFWGFESMPEEASDLILSLILLSSAEVALGSYPSPKIDTEAVNQIAEKYEIARKFLELQGRGQ